MMDGKRIRIAQYLAIGLGAVFLSCNGTPQAGAETNMDDIKAAAEPLKGARIFFGHQSVGANILRELKAATGETLVKDFQSGDTASAGILQSHIGVNGQPDTKCAGFARDIESAGGRFDLAVMKFCYVDFTAGVDPAALLEAYSRNVEALRAKYPSLAFVHVTTPLKSSEGLKSAVKKLLGKGDADLENVRRNEYNELLLAKYANEPVFDLAKVESTRPDGSRETFTRGGKTYYRLAREYTDDGGHLNAAGGKRAAAEFVKALSGALQRKAARAGDREPAPAARAEG